MAVGDRTFSAQLYIYMRALLALYATPMWKWINTKVTGRCELLRIQYDEQPGAFRTRKTEQSLSGSKVKECRLILSQEENFCQLLETIMTVKKIQKEKHPIFQPRFTECVEKIHGYGNVISEVENLKNQKYDDLKHQAELLKLWRILKPGYTLESRFTRQWGDIGFQGEDPATDFRGMGLLGFRNLTYIAEQHTDLARQMLTHSNHPKHGYFFAIVGINMTALCYNMLKDGRLKPHFYNLSTKTPNLDDFHKLYCYVFAEFDKLWFREKPDIMRFNEMRDKLELELVKRLKQPSVSLSLSSTKSNLVTQEI